MSAGGSLAQARAVICCTGARTATGPCTKCVSKTKVDSVLFDALLRIVARLDLVTQGETRCRTIMAVLTAAPAWCVTALHPATCPLHPVPSQGAYAITLTLLMNPVWRRRSRSPTLALSQTVTFEALFI